MFIPEHWSHRKIDDPVEKKERRKAADRRAFITRKENGKDSAYQRQYRQKNGARMREAARADYARDPAKHNAYMREWRIKNIDKARARERAYYHANKEIKGHYNKVYRLGISLTLEEFRQMTETQKGLCAICGKSQHQANRKKALDIDHCHLTGKVRALLCSSCNRGMGLFGDDPTLIQKAVDYLVIHQAKADDQVRL